MHELLCKFRLIDKRDNSVYKLSCQIRFIISLVYLLSIFLSYMLMLIVMTFNGGVFIVTVLGLTTGYFIFGFIRKTKYTRIYNPEGDKCCAEVDGWRKKNAAVMMMLCIIVYNNDLNIIMSKRSLIQLSFKFISFFEYKYNLKTSPYKCVNIFIIYDYIKSYW